MRITTLDGTLHEFKKNGHCTEYLVRSVEGSGSKIQVSDVAAEALVAGLLPRAATWAEVTPAGVTVQGGWAPCIVTDEDLEGYPESPQ